MKSTTYITTSTGQKVHFDDDRLRSSLQRVGAKPEVIERIVQQVTTMLYDGISTHKIYGLAFRLLREASRPVAARYSLKKALMELGPSGFPFEVYFAQLLAEEGYTVKNDQIIQGHCVTHEVDIVAEKDNTLYYIECKYHNSRGIVADVKIPLYIRSRVNDIVEHQKQQKENEGKQFKGWVVTNTRFTTDAIQYGLCSGLELVAWDFPENDKSLKKRIDATRLYPITCLTTLTGAEKQTLLNQKIVLCRTLDKNEKLLISIGIKPNRLKTVLDECALLCSIEIK
jgi:hypothetical protein